MNHCRRVLVVGAVLAILAAACSGGDDDRASSSPSPVASPERDVVLAAADRVEREGSARLRGRSRTTSAGEPDSSSFEAVFDFRTGNARVEVNSLVDVPERVEMRFVDGVVYYEAAMVVGGGVELLPGVRWVSLDPATAASELGEGFAGGVDPSAFDSTLDALRAMTEVEAVGTEDVVGVATTHYRGEVDPADVVADAPDATGENFVEQFGDAPFSFDVWIDDEGWVRKAASDVTVVADGDEVRVETEIAYSDFGIEVDVEAPLASETVDFSEIFLGGPTAGG